jgi:serine/threonine protein kinase
LILSKNFEEFWKIVEKECKRSEDYFSKDFKDLINSMIHPNPESRPTLDWIKNESLWYKNESVSTP